MQDPPITRPTFHGFIDSTHDALLLFEACLRGQCPKIRRRLHERERSLIASGSVFVFHEKEAGIRRWTDSLQWSPSRILNNFLIYRELDRREGRINTGSNSGRVSPAPACLEARPSNEPVIDVNLGSELTAAQLSRERTLLGSLTSSYRFKHDGLIKKTISVNNMHMISYYKLTDVVEGRLRTPSSLVELLSLEISPALLVNQNFRVPPKLEMGDDGQPRYVGENDDNSALVQGQASSSRPMRPAGVPPHNQSFPPAPQPLSIPRSMPYHEYSNQPIASPSRSFHVAPPARQIPKRSYSDFDSSDVVIKRERIEDDGMELFDSQGQYAAPPTLAYAMQYHQQSHPPTMTGSDFTHRSRNNSQVSLPNMSDTYQSHDAQIWQPQQEQTALQVPGSSMARRSTTPRTNSSSSSVAEMGQAAAPNPNATLLISNRVAMQELARREHMRVLLLQQNRQAQAGYHPQSNERFADQPSHAANLRHGLPSPIDYAPVDNLSRPPTQPTSYEEYGPVTEMQQQHQNVDDIYGNEPLWSPSGMVSPHSAHSADQKMSISPPEYRMPLPDVQPFPFPKQHMPFPDVIPPIPMQAYTQAGDHPAYMTETQHQLNPLFKHGSNSSSYQTAPGHSSAPANWQR